MISNIIMEVNTPRLACPRIKNNGKVTTVTHAEPSPKAAKDRYVLESPLVKYSICAQMPRTTRESKVTSAKTIVRSKGMIAILPRGQEREVGYRDREEIGRAHV